jgi:hypothetical protein
MALEALLALGCSVADLTSGDLRNAFGNQSADSGVADSGSYPVDVSVRDVAYVRDVANPTDGADGAEATDSRDAALPDGGEAGTYVSLVPPSTAVGLQNLLNLRYLDVANASTSDGAQIYTWSHTGGSNQLWTFQAQLNGTYTIMNQNSGSCVDVEGSLTGDGTPVQQYFCWQPGLNQQFVLVPFAGNVQIVGAQSGKCLTSVAQEDGAPVYIWDCSSDLSQQWALAQ